MILGHAEESLRPARIFSDNMVLQQGSPVPVWGTSAPNEKVTVEYAGQRVETKSDQKGKWKHVLRKSKLYNRRQDFDFKSYFINGAIYIIHRELVIKKKIYDNKNHGFFIMPKYRSIDINDVNEIKIVEPLLKKK